MSREPSWSQLVELDARQRRLGARLDLLSCQRRAVALGERLDTLQLRRASGKAAAPPPPPPQPELEAGEFGDPDDEDDHYGDHGDSFSDNNAVLEEAAGREQCGSVFCGTRCALPDKHSGPHYFGLPPSRRRRDEPLRFGWAASSNEVQLPSAAATRAARRAMLQAERAADEEEHEAERGVDPEERTTAAPAAAPAAAPSNPPAPAPAPAPAAPTATHHDPLAADQPPYFDAGAIITRDKSVPSWARRGLPKRYSKRHMAIDTPVEDIPPSTARAQWLLHGLTRAQTSVRSQHTNTSLSNLDKCKMVLEQAPWAFESMDAAPPAKVGFTPLTPQTLTEDDVDALYFRAQAAIQADTDRMNITPPSRYKMEDQPYERWAWIEHWVWAWNCCKGLCPNCKKEMTFHFPGSNFEDIYDRTGKKNSGPVDNAFTLQRRCNLINHVHSNIQGALCANCNIRAVHQHTPPYTGQGGAYKVWSDALQEGLIDVTNVRQDTYYAIWGRAKYRLTQSGIPRCTKHSVAARTCRCLWHNRLRSEMEKIAADQGQDLEQLRREKHDMEKVRRKRRQRKSQQPVLSDSDEDGPGDEIESIDE